MRSAVAIAAALLASAASFPCASADAVLPSPVRGLVAHVIDVRSMKVDIKALDGSAIRNNQVTVHLRGVTPVAASSEPRALLHVANFFQGRIVELRNCNLEPGRGGVCDVYLPMAAHAWSEVDAAKFLIAKGLAAPLIER